MRFLILLLLPLFSQAQISIQTQSSLPSSGWAIAADNNLTHYVTHGDAVSSLTLTSPTSFTRTEKSLSPHTNIRGLSLDASYVYTVAYGENPGKLIRILRSDFSTSTELSLTITNAFSVLNDATNIYVLHYGSPNVVSRISKSDFSTITTLTLTGSTNGTHFTHDDNYLYVNNGSTSIIRVNKSDFSTTQTLSLEATYSSCFGMSEDATYVYVIQSNASSTRIARILKSDFSTINYVTPTGLTSGEGLTNDANYIYFTALNSSQPKLVSLSKSNFSATAETSINAKNSAGLSSFGGYVYCSATNVNNSQKIPKSNFLSFGSNSTQSKTAANSIGTSPTTPISAGALAIAAIAVDNSTSGDGDFSDVITISDGLGNTWVKAREFTNGQGGANTGATVSVWYSILTTTVGTTNTVTATFSSSRTAKAMFLKSYGLEPGTNTITIAATATLADDNVDLGPLSFAASSLPLENHLFLRASAFEAAVVGGGGTVGGWVNSGTVGTTGGGGASNMSAFLEHYLTYSSGGVTSDPSTTAADGASVLIAFSGSYVAPAPPKPRKIYLIR